MREKNLRQKVVKALNKLDAIAVENSVYPGTPDVNYSEGWIELKYAENWPARGGPLRMEHYTAQQKLWARRRARAGGKVFLLLQVGREHLLLAGDVAGTVLGSGTRQELIDQSIKYWPNTLDKEELIKCVS